MKNAGCSLLDGLSFILFFALQGSYRLEYAVVRSVHGRLKLGLEHPKSNEHSERTKRKVPTKPPRHNKTRHDQQLGQDRHRQRGLQHQHHQQDARRDPRRQSAQDVRGVDLLQHLANEEETCEHDYEKPLF